MRNSISHPKHDVKDVCSRNLRPVFLCSGPKTKRQTYNKYQLGVHEEKKKRKHNHTRRLYVGNKIKPTVSVRIFVRS